MKKLFALLLAAVMLAAALSGCIVIEPATTDPSDTEKPGSNFPSFFGPVTDPDPTDPPQAVVKPTLEETLVYDDNGVKVYARGENLYNTLCSVIPTALREDGVEAELLPRQSN